MRHRVTAAALTGTALLVTLATAATDSPALASGPHRDGFGTTPAVVVHGLNNPRQISFAPDGSMLVAEAGRGGDQCIPFGEGGAATCLGMTGSVSRVRYPASQRSATPVRVISGLVSQAGPDGSSATGADGVAAVGSHEVYLVMSGTPPVQLPDGIDGSLFAKLVRSRTPGTPRVAADLAAHELAEDPDGQGFESSPYAVLALPDRVLVADAAGNDIVQWRHGRLSTFATFANIEDGACAGLPNQAGSTGCDAVPSGLAVGRDGSIYVAVLGALTPGAGRVYRLDGRTGRITRQWTGLSAVTGVAVGPDGSVYASQLFTEFGATGPELTSGRVTRLGPDGRRTDAPVPLPAGLAVAGRNLYVSAWSTAPATGLGLPGTDSSGQVWRLRI